MKVEKEDVRRTAELARLTLSDDELSLLAEQLSTILEHMDALATAPAEDPGADDQPQQQAPVRPDVPGADQLVVSPEVMAPAWADDFFTVPRMASHDDQDGGRDVDGEAPG